MHKEIPWQYFLYLRYTHFPNIIHNVNVPNFLDIDPIYLVSAPIESSQRGLSIGAGMTGNGTISRNLHGKYWKYNDIFLDLNSQNSMLVSWYQIMYCILILLQPHST